MTREWFVRDEADTGPNFGCVPLRRPAEELLERGVVVLDKPFGPPSNQVSSWLRKSLDLGKTGHFGTLDPHATGVLPVGLNRGTRLSPALSEAQKEYVFEVSLSESVSESNALEALKGFVGENRQVPPEKSAVERKERSRELYEAELLECLGDNLLARVRCESGFYVRVLVDQLGDQLGIDAEMPDLRRTSQGEISVEECVTLQEAVEAYQEYSDTGEVTALRNVVRPPEAAVGHLPKLAIKDTAVNAVANGADLGAGGISRLQEGISEGDRVAIMTLKGELVALATAEMTSEQMYEEHGSAADLESVHMEPERYPRRWN